MQTSFVCVYMYLCMCISTHSTNSTLHSIPLHCTALHSTPLHSIPLHSTEDCLVRPAHRTPCTVFRRGEAGTRGTLYTLLYIIFTIYTTYYILYTSILYTSYYMLIYCILYTTYYILIHYTPYRRAPRQESPNRDSAQRNPSLSPL
jgi:hypothetical protein